MVGVSSQINYYEKKAIDQRVRYTQKQCAVLSDQIVINGFRNYNMSSLSDEAGEKVFEEDIEPVTYIEEHGLKIVEDTGLLTDTLQKIMDENPGPLEELLGGKEKVFGFFVGKMMRELKGKASPDAVREALVKEVE